MMVGTMDKGKILDYLKEKPVPMTLARGLDFGSRVTIQDLIPNPLTPNPRKSSFASLRLAYDQNDSMPLR